MSDPTLQYIIAHGNIITGMHFIGPFDEIQDAHNYLDQMQDLGCDEAVVSVLESPVKLHPVCEKHEWIDVTNKVVSGTMYCQKCGALDTLDPKRLANAQTDNGG